MLRINSRSDVAHQRLIYLYAMTLRRPQMIQQIRRAMELQVEPVEAYGYLIAASNLKFSDGLLRTDEWLEQSPDNESVRVAHAIYAARSKPTRAMVMFSGDESAVGNQRLIEECRRDYPDNLEVRAFFAEKAIADGDEIPLAQALDDLPDRAEEE